MTFVTELQTSWAELWPILLMTLNYTGWVLGFIYLVLFVLPLVPGTIAALTNKPNRNRPKNKPEAEINTHDYKPDRFGFFTFLQPGRVKMIERNGRFIRAIMDYDGRKFDGELPNELTSDQPGYWKVIDTPKGRYDSHPIPFPVRKLGLRILIWLLYWPLSILHWFWKRWVYWLTGGIFTGISSFQGVRVYPMERLRKITLSDGSVVFIRIEDYSDHFRVADFQYPVVVLRADTQDKLPAEVTFNEIGRTENPYLTAYNTDDEWPQRFRASVTDAISNFTRSRPLNEVLSAKDRTKASAREFTRTVTEDAAESLKEIGIILRESQNIDISPVLDDTSKVVGAVALAIIERDALKERAVGQAAQLRETGRALNENPEAVVTSNNEAMVRAAEAAGKNGFVFLGGGKVSAGQAALIREIRNLRTGQ